MFGLAIAAYILYSAVRIAMDAVHSLMDRELPEPQRRQIADLARSVPEVQGVHGLRARQSGRGLIIQLHLALEDEMPLRAAHQVGLEVEARIRGVYPKSDILIHHDPATLGDEGETL